MRVICSAFDHGNEVGLRQGRAETLRGVSNRAVREAVRRSSDKRQYLAYIIDYTRRATEIGHAAPQLKNLLHLAPVV